MVGRRDGAFSREPGEIKSGPAVVSSDLAWKNGTQPAAAEHVCMY